MGAGANRTGSQSGGRAQRWRRHWLIGQVVATRATRPGPPPWRAAIHLGDGDGANDGRPHPRSTTTIDALKLAFIHSHTPPGESNKRHAASPPPRPPANKWMMLARNDKANDSVFGCRPRPIHSYSTGGESSIHRHHMCHRWIKTILLLLFGRAAARRKQPHEINTNAAQTHARGERPRELARPNPPDTRQGPRGSGRPKRGRRQKASR